MTTTTHTVEAGYLNLNNGLNIELVQYTPTQVVVVITHNGEIWTPFMRDTTIRQYLNTFTNGYGTTGNVSYDTLSYTMRQVLQELDNEYLWG